MAKTTFQGPVKSINGFQGVGTGNSVTIGAITSLMRFSMLVECCTTISCWCSYFDFTCDYFI